MAKRQPTQSVSAVQPQSSPFPYADYLAARQALLGALQGPSFYALLTGASGMGKTSLLRELRGELDGYRYHVIYLSSTRVSVFGIVRFIAQKLHVSPRCSSLETVNVLSEAIQAQNARLLLWLDEADLVEAHTLQEVRMLAEASHGIEQLFSVVLSGLPSLLALLDAPALFPLKRRISRRYVLAGLRHDELAPFLEHRFGSIDADRIPRAVGDELFERTQATPALIDQVVRHALATADGNIDPEVIRATLDTAGL